MLPNFTNIGSSIYNLKGGGAGDSQTRDILEIWQAYFRKVGWKGKREAEKERNKDRGRETGTLVHNGFADMTSCCILTYDVSPVYKFWCRENDTLTRNRSWRLLLSYLLLGFLLAEITNLNFLTGTLQWSACWLIAAGTCHLISLCSNPYRIMF
jgi:hypothetical protein